MSPNKEATPKKKAVEQNRTTPKKEKMPLKRKIEDVIEVPSEMSDTESPEGLASREVEPPKKRIRKPRAKKAATTATSGEAEPTKKKAKKAAARKVSSTTITVEEVTTKQITIDDTVDDVPSIKDPPTRTSPTGDTTEEDLTPIEVRTKRVKAKKSVTVVATPVPSAKVINTRSTRRTKRISSPKIIGYGLDLEMRTQPERATSREISEDFRQIAASDEPGGGFARGNDRTFIGVEDDVEVEKMPKASAKSKGKKPAKGRKLRSSKAKESVESTKTAGTKVARGTKRKADTLDDSESVTRGPSKKVAKGDKKPSTVAKKTVKSLKVAGEQAVGNFEEDAHPSEDVQSSSPQGGRKAAGTRRKVPSIKAKEIMEDLEPAGKQAAKGKKGKANASVESEQIPTASADALKPAAKGKGKGKGKGQKRGPPSEPDEEPKEVGKKAPKRAKKK